MVFKLNISERGKAWKLELADETLVGKSIGEAIEGKELGADFEGYELMITGGSDIAGFPLSKDVEGIGSKRVLLTRGFAMRDAREGVRLRKLVRGKTISTSTMQINMNVVKAGKKALAAIFPDQNKVGEVASTTTPAASAAP